MDNLDTAGTEGQVDTSAQVADGGAVTTPQEPQPIELDENALIRIKGQDKPVKFGEYGRNFQSQFTKASQEAARLKRELDAERAQRAELQKQQEAYKRSQQSAQQGDPYAALRELPYLDGEAAARVVQGIEGQMRQRDQILLGTLNQLKELKAIVTQLHQNHVGSSFESKLDKWFQENSWDPSFRNLAKEVYLGYEPTDDLDVEFPNIFTNRISEIEKAIEARKQAAIQKAKQNRFVPGKGGNIGPSQPLQAKGDETAREIAEKMWEQFQNSGT